MKLRRMSLYVLSALLAGATLWAGTARAEEVLAHARPRPPELVVKDHQVSGPLKDVLDEAMAKLGMTVNWQEAPFARSVKDMQDGKDVIVPRVRRTAAREVFMTYLGPIAVQKRSVMFAVRKGATQIKKYEDLAKLSIGVKRGSDLFERFDTDKSLKKSDLVDDANLVKLLQAGRIDTVATSDPASFDAAVAKLGWTGAGYADYVVPLELGNYYAVGKTSKLAGKADAINGALKAMVDAGRVKAIYAKYGLDPEKIE